MLTDNKWLITHQDLNLNTLVEDQCNTTHLANCSIFKRDSLYLQSWFLISMGHLMPHSGSAGDWVHRYSLAQQSIYHLQPQLIFQVSSVNPIYICICTVTIPEQYNSLPTSGNSYHSIQSTATGVVNSGQPNSRRHP